MAQTSDDRATGRAWPGYLFGGRVRTSTIALILAFVVIWWAYESYGPATQTAEQVPAAEVVPPGFIPDPAYTWVPRTDVQRSPTTTTTTPTTTTTSAEATTTSPTATTSPAEDSDTDADTTTTEPTTTTASTPSPSAAPSPATTPATAPATTPATPTP